MVCSVLFRRAHARLRNAPVSPAAYLFLFVFAAMFAVTAPASASHPDLRDIGQEGDPGDGVLNPSVPPEGKDPGAGYPVITPELSELDTPLHPVRWVIIPIIFHNGMPIGEIFLPRDSRYFLGASLQHRQVQQRGSSSARRWSHAP